MQKARKFKAGKQQRKSMEQKADSSNISIINDPRKIKEVKREEDESPTSRIKQGYHHRFCSY